MTKMNIVQAINSALTNEMDTDPSVVIMGEDVGRDGGVFRVTEGLLQKYGSERVIDTPLSELGIVGAAIGMAAFGLRPIAEIQFDGFLPPAMDQLFCHAARLRTRSRGRYTVPLVVRAPYSGGIRAPEHHSDSPEAYFVHTPGLKVVIPATPYDAKGLLISAMRDPDPVIFLEPKKIYRAIKEEVPDDSYTVPMGKAKIIQEGSDITLITYGAMTIPCLEAAQTLKNSIEIIDVRTLSPLDEETILASVKKTGRTVIVHEAPRSCGFGAELSAIIAEKALFNLEAPIERVTGFDTIMPLAKLEDYYIPDAFRVAKAITKVMSY